MRTAAAGALVLALLVAPGALAQSAGDKQYFDPLQESEQRDSDGSAGGGGSQEGSGGGSQEGSGGGSQGTQTQQRAQAAAPQAPAQGSATESGGDLPRSGLPAGALAAAGLALLSAGLALRRAVRR